MSYPATYDELLSRDDMLKGLTETFDSIHLHIKKLRRENPRGKELRPHKVATHINDVLAKYIRNYKPEYLTSDQTNQSNLSDCNHVLSTILGEDILGCELCPKTFNIYEITEECIS